MALGSDLRAWFTPTLVQAMHGQNIKVSQLILMLCAPVCPHPPLEFGFASFDCYWTWCRSICKAKNWEAQREGTPLWECAAEEPFCSSSSIFNKKEIQHKTWSCTKVERKYSRWSQGWYLLEKLYLTHWAGLIVSCFISGMSHYRFFHGWFMEG